MKIITRETRAPKIHNDILHKYNIYIPCDKNMYVNIYTCMCCTKTFTEYQSKIDEPDTGVTINNIPIETLKHWYTDLQNKHFTIKHYDLIMHTLETLIEQRSKIYE